MLSSSFLSATLSLSVSRALISARLAQSRTLSRRRRSINILQLRQSWLNPPPDRRTGRLPEYPTATRLYLLRSKVERDFPPLARARVWHFRGQNPSPWPMCSPSRVWWEDLQKRKIKARLVVGQCGFLSFSKCMQMFSFVLHTSNLPSFRALVGAFYSMIVSSCWSILGLIYHEHMGSDLDLFTDWPCVVSLLCVIRTLVLRLDNLLYRWSELPILGLVWLWSKHIDNQYCIIIINFLVKFFDCVVSLYKKKKGGSLFIKISPS